MKLLTHTLFTSYLFVLTILTCAVALNTTSDASIPPGLEKIEHFVIIMQENRAFDEYFGTYPGADGIPSGVCLPDTVGGGCVAPYHDTNDVNRGGPHGWDNAHADINNGKMDGFVKEAYKGKSAKGRKIVIPLRPLYTGKGSQRCDGLP